MDTQMAEHWVLMLVAWKVDLMVGLWVWLMVGLKAGLLVLRKGLPRVVQMVVRTEYSMVEQLVVKKET